MKIKNIATVVASTLLAMMTLCSAVSAEDGTFYYPPTEAERTNLWNKTGLPGYRITTSSSDYDPTLQYDENVTLCTKNMEGVCTILRDKYGFKDEFYVTGYNQIKGGDLAAIQSKAYEINVSWTTDEGDASAAINSAVNGCTTKFANANLSVDDTWTYSSDLYACFFNLTSATMDVEVNSARQPNRLVVARVFTDTYVKDSTVELEIVNGTVIVGGLNKNSDKGWNAAYAKYKDVIIGVSGLATLTCLIVLIILIIKMGGSSSNAKERAKYMTGILFCGAGIAALGSITVVFGIFYNAF